MMQDFSSAEDGFQTEGTSYSGHLLVAHPWLRDPNFHQTVVLISTHDQTEGATGVVLNRPLARTFGDLSTEISAPSLADLPVYTGGPVAPGNCLLAGFRLSADSHSLSLYFGLSAERLSAMLSEDPNLEARAFVGYSGWAAGQLEAEIGQDSWLVCPFESSVLYESPESIWKSLARRWKPGWIILAEQPPDPSKN